MTEAPLITVTTLDRDRLRQMIHLSTLAGPAATPAIVLLSKALTEARAVAPSDISRHVATINSHVTYRTQGRGSRAHVAAVTLVPPADADMQLGRASVLAPTGSALLGLAEGESIEWPDEAGQMARYTLLQVVFQPGAVGRFDL
ncbi:GreA/GreB family elongation factor [Bosea sp. 2KB_26]|uniref:GreA/GreB family elongation factor n=1 Tax=Bosea sp. 2KB_26 TaxID=3237475 RepID=UPI003F917C09